MITFDYLKSVLAGWVNAESHTINTGRELVEAPDIMEGLTQLAQETNRPYAILFEEAYHYDDDDRNDVPVTRFAQSIYVMRMAQGGNGNRREEQLCLEDVKRLRWLLLERWGADDAELAGWTRHCTRDFVEGASNYVGWKLKLDFVENENWSHGEG